MLKKAFKKLIGKSKKPEKKKPVSFSRSSSKPPLPRILTAEGWKRLMMKKYRNSK